MAAKAGSPNGSSACAWRIVYDGPPDKLTPEVLTKIHCEEDWSATIREVDEDAADDAADNVARFDTPQPHRYRMAELT